MIRLTPAQRRVLIAHLPELANVAAGSSLFGQFLSDFSFSLTVAFMGLGAWTALMGFVLVLVEDDRS